MDMNFITKRLFEKINTKQAERRLASFYRHQNPSGSSTGSVLQYVGISSMYLTETEILLNHLLRRENFDVDYLIYDESIPINEVITKQREETVGKDRFWSKSCRNGRRKLRLAQVEFETIPVAEQAIATSRSLPTLDAILSFNLDNIDFGNIVEGAMFRYYKSLTFGKNADSVARRFLTTSLSNYYCVKQKCESKNYRYVMFSHGIYVTWQPVAEYCKRQGIDYICYDRGKTKNTCNFNVNRPSPEWNFESAWQRHLHRHLDDGESTWVEEYLKDRETQKGDVYSYNPVAKADNTEQERLRLGIPTDRKVITIFTNLIWDAANVSRDIAFGDCLDCITTTIEHFRLDPSVHVVIRSHPAEKVLGTSQQYKSLVQNHFQGCLPENTTLVGPDDQINSFTMIDISDIGVVNTSTVGLEMAMLNKPVILISETHYRAKGFTYDSASSEEYFDQIHQLIANPEALPNQEELARKYFYMMMALYQQPMPTMFDSKGRFQAYSCNQISELPDSEPIVRIVTRLADKLPSDFIEWEPK